LTAISKFVLYRTPLPKAAGKNQGRLCPSVLLVRVSLGPVHPEVFLAEVKVEIEKLVVDGALAELTCFGGPILN
jgi:hypothetical protein